MVRSGLDKLHIIEITSVVPCIRMLRIRRSVAEPGTDIHKGSLNFQQL